MADTKWEAKRQTNENIMGAWSATYDYLGSVESAMRALERYKTAGANVGSIAADIARFELQATGKIVAACQAAWRVDEWLTRAHVELASREGRPTTIIRSCGDAYTNYHLAYLLGLGSRFLVDLRFALFPDGRSYKDDDDSIAKTIKKNLPKVPDAYGARSVRIQRIANARIKVEAVIAAQLWEESYRTDEDELLQPERPMPDFELQVGRTAEIDHEAFWRDCQANLGRSALSEKYGISVGHVSTLKSQLKRAKSLQK